MRSRRRSRSGRRRNTTALALLLGLIAATVAVGAVVGVSSFVSSCDLRSLQPAAIGQNSFVYAADGSLIGSIPAERNRQPVRLDQLSEWVAEATVAIEDRRFFEHGGVDLEGIIRAAVRNLQQGEIVQGGSTITQQLVRNLYIGNERSLARKTKEACLAIRLDREWTKGEILESYLNQVYFGNHAYGIEAAAQTYFSKHASELGLAESAMLAGLPQAPSTYDPFQRPKQALRRRNEVLRAMLQSGSIDQERLRKAVRQPLGLERGKTYTRIRESFFFNFVRALLVEKYGAALVRSGGLRVFTTIDPALQRAARNAIRSTLTERTDPASALVSINPENGAIRAMVAVVPGRDVEFNLAVQGRRQAGSAFKTFVLAEAIRERIDPDNTYYPSLPLVWQPDPFSEPWRVKTYDNVYYGSSSITQATLRSDNTVYARLTLDLGPERVVEMAHLLGIRTKLEVVASVGLGSNSVTVLEMASAYATLAASGVYSEPMAIQRVVLPDGTLDSAAGWGVPSRKRVLSAAAAFEVTRILEQNILRGTGTGASIGRPAAGKTGTTDNYADAWFVGYTPTLATGVWIGYPNAQIEMTDVHGLRVAGGTFPATIWRLFMSAALESVPIAAWSVPREPLEWASQEERSQLPAEPDTSETTATEPATTEPVETGTENSPPAETQPPDG